jgi:hypothetical protein
MDVPIYLVADGVNDSRMAVPKGVDCKTAEEVKVSLTILANKIAAFAPINFERNALVGFEKELGLEFERSHRSCPKTSVKIFEWGMLFFPW